MPRANPKIKASAVSRLFFLWMIDIIRQGNKEDFEEDDIPEAMPDHKSEFLTNGLEKKWEEEKNRASIHKRSPSLTKAIIRQFGLQFLYMCLLYLLKDLISAALSPYLLGVLLHFFKPASTLSQSDALLTATTLSLTTFIVGLITVHFMNSAQLFAIRVRAACISMVYRKCLRLSQSAMSETSPGHIINLVSNDVARFELVTYMMMPMLSAPFLSAILIYLNYQIGGPASLAGAAALVIILVIQFANAKFTAYYRLKVVKRTDERVRMMDEIVLGIQVIKYYAWEKPFQAFIDHARMLELKILRKLSFLRLCFMIFSLFSPRVSLFCTLLVLVLSDAEIDPSAFVMLIYFVQLANNLGGFVTRGFEEIYQCLVSIHRIQEFLLLDEYRPVVSTNMQKAKNENRGGMENGGVLVEGEWRGSIVTLEGVSAKWTKNGDMTLTNLNLDIQAGQLVAVIGPVGSGKSSMLNLLLGELIKKEGKFKVQGVVSYAAQEPWIFSSSVRQNILFHEDYNSSRYKAVCKVCQLERDFELLPRGDKTLVGEKGASLSGGQKARISLARAVYKKADIYLLDDPLSAVDSHVSKHLFYHCIEEFLGDKTRILVTHQVQHLSKVNHLILMDSGRILAQGTFKELRRSRHNFASVLTTPELEKGPFQFLGVEPSLQRNVQRRSTRSERSINVAGDEVVEFEEFENDREAEQISHTPATQVYQQYLRAGVSPAYCCVVASLFILTQLTVSGFDYWVAYWLHREEDRLVDPESSELWPTTTYLAILGCFLMCIAVVGSLRGLAYYEGCIRSSRGVHTQMFRSLIKTSLSFFHNNPSGRILNRFSRDLGAADELMAKAVMDMGQAFAQVAGALLIAISVNFWLSIPITILTCVLWTARNICLNASKKLKRIEGIIRSPIYAHINASLQGLVTIRANSAEKLLQYELSRYLDSNTSATHIFYNTMAFLALVQEFVTTSYMTVCIFSFTLFKSAWSDTNAGLIITQCLTMMGYLHWGMKMSAEAANQMVCIERALEYTQLEPEEYDQDGKVNPEPSWPQFGMIEMRCVFLRYDITEPYVLRNLNLTILPQEKIGIVGRTGAGKSSLITALFRLAPVEGQIFMDGLDTGTVPLERLRSGISIIPQDPVLFSGTIRTNLDPFQRYSDAQLYSVLQEVKLNDSNQESELLNLDTQVTEGGGNFSLGQRQLVCLARAILRSNKILVLDEATANVDPQTDALIQSTIRHRFTNCTVLTVAHRLNTVIDSDRILVMENGTIAEFDHPHILLSNSDGLFFHLVQQTGFAMARDLAVIAEQNFKNL
ncbi:ATP-binding cassette sub-family C member 4-like [Macrosteles quadrilineatus]|uniref:ATP-binding cassette sub-family C member 4-like n=1 Tax=Macrosteles quadrilineatus TaxID=74068 RepID=UPI0023E307AB|nr:ATP-binding cassette sub-family C member 4-like [Macrosteles quadrilineatus]